MDKEEFKIFWRKNYKECQPLGYELREHYKNQWLRIHALPNSKRYPDTENEYNEVLYRHNCILENLLGSNKPYLLLVTDYIESNSSPIRKEFIKLSNIEFTYALTIDKTNTYFSDDMEVDIYTAALTWNKGSINMILKFIADDKLSNVLIIGLTNKFIYHPYDGGADIIIVSDSLRSRIYTEYLDWVSTHPEGL
jgi:hypothetical protein